ncbi:hypothetical protein [Streptomyces sp. XY006]|uniref:hypothetical protein n=1 Tax=Streptomyces sp. XY006 TaxID=2021410 RepID=UPI0015C617FF|nr:hypothetical protein [Streptomyces sp. XY006]
MADRIDPQHQTHDPRTCQLCASLRHPAQAAQGRALQAHLAENPLPQQGAGR